MNDARRNTHQFIELTALRCPLRIDGPVTGRSLLPIHGATVPGWEFDRVVPFLNDAGFSTGPVRPRRCRDRGANRARRAGAIRCLAMVAPMLNFFANAPAAQLAAIPFVGELVVAGYVALVRRRTRRYRAIADGRYAEPFREQVICPGSGGRCCAAGRSATRASATQR